jgi:probable HAF family extracellular repeat protein
MFARKLLLKLLSAAVLATPLSAFADPGFTLTFLPENFRAYDIGSNGLVVGSLGSSDAFVPSTWTGGVLTTYGTLGGPRGQFNAISSNGLMTGVSDLAGDSNGHAFLFQGGALREIASNIGPEAIAIDVNSSGQVAGYLLANGVRVLAAFEYSNGNANLIATDTFRFARATGINDAGVVIGDGERWDTDATHAFMYHNGVTTDLGALDPSTDYSEAYGINAAGDIVGTSLDAASAYHAFMYSHGAMHDLGSFDGLAIAYDINNAGAVVGFGANSAFLYADGRMLDLNALLVGYSGDMRLTSANAINDAGQIIGRACTVDFVCRDVLLDPVSVVPEPGTWAMLIAGLAGLALRRKRRARRTPSIPAPA